MGGEVLELLNDRAARLEREAREQGIEEGREIGIQQGIEKGIEKGIEQGIEQGKAQGIDELATELHKRGIDQELIDEAVAAIGKAKG